MLGETHQCANQEMQVKKVSSLLFFGLWGQSLLFTRGSEPTYTGHVHNRGGDKGDFGDRKKGRNMLAGSEYKTLWGEWGEGMKSNGH